MFPHPFLHLFGCRVSSLRSQRPTRLTSPFTILRLRHDHCPPGGQFSAISSQHSEKINRKLIA